MPEQRQPEQQLLSIGGSLFDDATDEDSGGLVTVLHAPYTERLPVGEMTVREVRERFTDRLDIHPEAAAFVDGTQVDNETVVHEGQRLMFMRPSGEKGADGQQVVTVEGDEVHATLPEGTEGRMKLSDLLHRMAPSVPDTCGVILPDGVKCAVPFAGGVALVHQTPPQVYGFEWIANDSPEEFGPGTRYRKVRLALPYVIVLAVFQHAGRGVPMLSQRNECFFTNEPLEARGLATPLSYPALLNCSKMEDLPGRPLSWICTQHLSKREARARGTLEASIRGGLTALLRHLFESGFNRSSEVHEGESGFGASTAAGIDPRVATVEAWDQATREDPLFAIDVPWLPTERTLGEVLERVGKLGKTRGRTFDTAADLARVIFSAPAARRRSA